MFEIDQYLIGDWNGDGIDDLGIRQDNRVFMDYTHDGIADFVQEFGTGNNEDEYLVGDWDGDGRDNLAVRRGFDILMDTNFDGEDDLVQQYGILNGEDEYLVGDWDGDGRDNLAVRRGFDVLMDTNFDGQDDLVQQYGILNGEDEYLVGDWDGDGRDNLAVRRGFDVLMDTNFDGQDDLVQQYGILNGEDEYLVGDWDGDGRDNLAVRRGFDVLMDTNFDGEHDFIRTLDPNAENPDANEFVIDLATDLGLTEDPIDVGNGVLFLGEGIDPDDLNIDKPDNLDAADATNTDQLWSGGGLDLNLSGNGLTVGIWEATEPDTNSWRVRDTHEALTGRVTIEETGGGPNFSDHATHVAGTIGAAVNPTNPDSLDARGMANQVNLLSYSSGNDTVEMDMAASQIVASNHSYGQTTGWTIGTRNTQNVGQVRTNVWQHDYTASSTEDTDFGKYDTNAQALDQVLFNNPNLLSVWAAGNDRNDNLPQNQNSYVTFFGSNPNIPGFNWMSAGWYQVPTNIIPAPGGDGNGGTGYDSLPTDQVAKNTLVVGAVEDITKDPYNSGDVNITAFSSFGPTDDGRVKPDVVGNGDRLLSSGGQSDTHYYSSSGTSMAAPNVTGTATLLIEHYQNLFDTTATPRSATTKGLLIHTAFDAGNTGPDYQFGWGLVDGAAAATFLTDATAIDSTDWFQERSYSGSEQTITVESDGTESLKATIVWTDPAGAPQGGGLDVNTSVLVNDLDLWVTGADGTSLPWTLNPVNPAANAVRTSANRLDNVEQVLIDVPTAGDYTIHIGHGGSSFTQDYSLLVSGAEIRTPLGVNEAGDQFGAEVATGDFNDDGFEDLAVAAPQEAPGSEPQSGAVFIYLGTSSGELKPWQVLTQQDLGSNEDGDQFGTSLAVGDFDGDGKDDLAVGAPTEAPGANPESGYVFIFQGNSSGLQPWQGLDQQGLGDNESGDLFGDALAAGDFDGDGKDDLAVGAPTEAPGANPESGYVFIFQGNSSGLQPWQGLDQQGLGDNESGDLFGDALAAGDFDGDGKDDLAVGAPTEAPGANPESGYVFIFQGNSSGLQPWQGLDQQGLGDNESGDLFGDALAAGDFDGDGKDDLAVGAPTEAPGANPESGYVFIFQGNSSGLQPWQGLDQQGLGDNESGDLFGDALAAGDFDGDGKDDLAVGAPTEAPGANPESGYVFIFQGNSSGLQPWQGLDQQGLGDNEQGDAFSSALAAGDFDGDGNDDLAVGAPGEAPFSDPASGYAFIFQGQNNFLEPWYGLSQEA